MSKSSLKTFLAGKNPYNDDLVVLCGAKWLNETVTDEHESSLWFEHNQDFIDRWNIDVLDDGTAITYCGD